MLLAQYCNKEETLYAFNAVTNSELTELVPVFTTRPAFPTSVKKVNTSFKNVWRTWGPALPTGLPTFLISVKNMNLLSSSIYKHLKTYLIKHKQSLILGEQSF
jgi:hypothetical protein